MSDPKTRGGDSMETRKLSMDQVRTGPDGTFNLEAQLPMGFETRFIKKSITEHDSFPLYIKTIGESPADPIATVSLAIVDDHTLKISGRMDNPKRYHTATWPIYDLKMEIDAVDQRVAKVNRLVLEI